MSSPKQIPGVIGGSRVWRCYIDGQRCYHCHFALDEDGTVWPIFDPGFRPVGWVSIVLETA